MTETGPGPAALRRERTRLGWTQEELAERGAVSVRTVRGLEAGAVDRPRRSSVERLATALGLRGQDRRGFLAAWSYESSPRVRTFDDLVGDADDYEGMRGLSGPSIAHLETVSVRLEVMVRDRVVLWEQAERIVVPMVAPQTGTVHLLGHGIDSSVRATGVENCRVTARHLLDDQTTAFDVHFDRRVEVGRAHRFVVRSDAVHPPSTEGASRQAVFAVTRASRIAVVLVRFEPADPPSRVQRVTATDMAGALDVVEDVVVGETGDCELVLVDPVPGWHGVRWEWDHVRDGLRRRRTVPGRYWIDRTTSDTD